MERKVEIRMSWFAFSKKWLRGEQFIPDQRVIKNTGVMTLNQIMFQLLLLSKCLQLCC